MREQQRLNLQSFDIVCIQHTLNSFLVERIIKRKSSMWVRHYQVIIIKGFDHRLIDKSDHIVRKQSGIWIKEKDTVENNLTIIKRCNINLCTFLFFDKLKTIDSVLHDLDRLRNITIIMDTDIGG